METIKSRMDNLSACKNAVQWIKARSLLSTFSVSQKSVDDAESYYKLRSSLIESIPKKQRRKQK